MSEKVNHPSHYNALVDIECIDVIEHFDFCIGSAMKYLWRAGLKEGEADLDDYKKAIWYIERKIAKLTEERKLEENRLATADYMHAAFGNDGIYINNSDVNSSWCQ